MGSCLSPHLPLPQSSCVRLNWYPAGKDKRCRVVAWTCHCRSVHYELCESGGLAFIRRFTQGQQPAETHRVRVGEARATWFALLSGMAR